MPRVDSPSQNDVEKNSADEPISDETAEKDKEKHKEGPTTEIRPLVTEV